MSVSLLFPVLLVFPADPQAAASLFHVLDTNGDGRIVSTELSETQRPYFTRALRVADHNEDGALTREELAFAVSEPERMVISSPTNRRNGTELSGLDVNKDGLLSKEEVPQQLMPRLQRAFDAYGRNEIPLEVLRRMAQGLPPNTSKSPGTSPDMKTRQGTATSGMNSDQLQSAVRRLDTDQDGVLSRRELQKAPSVARALDRNRDGEVSAAELKLATRTQPGATGQRPSPANADAYFDRMDADKNGKLTGDEMPERMRQNISRIDGNGDKVVSREEFLQAVRGLQNRPK